MSTKTIDLNCDLGEWREKDGPLKDARIMPFISSCNVACGGHIGDSESMKKTIELAQNHGVKIGAHPAYTDRENFGRKVIKMSESELMDSLSNQITQLDFLINKAGEEMHHIKPHGALYNYAAKDEATAGVILEVIKTLKPKVPIYAQEGSVLAQKASESGIRVICEVFADRAYEDDLTLRSRTLEGAVLHDPNLVLEHVRRMVIHGEVITFSGRKKSITAQTMCLHSDTEGSIQLAEAIHEYLKKSHVEIIAP